MLCCLDNTQKVQTKLLTGRSLDKNKRRLHLNNLRKTKKTVMSKTNRKSRSVRRIANITTRCFFSEPRTAREGRVCVRVCVRALEINSS